MRYFICDQCESPCTLRNVETLAAGKSPGKCPYDGKKAAWVLIDDEGFE